MKIMIISQIQNKKTGLGKAVDDFINYCKGFSKVEELDITNNKKFISALIAILKSKSDVYYFTPAGSVFGNVRDTVYLLAMLIKNKKIVCHFHNSNFGNVVNSNKFLLIVNKYIYRKVNKIIVLGEKQKKMFSNLSIREEQYSIIRNGIDDDLFLSESSIKIKHKLKVKNIVYFSNMLEEKGYKIVLETAKKLKNKTDLKFYFSGKFFDENLRNEFEIEKSNLDNIEYISGVYGNDKKELLSKMNYFVLPSRYKDETLPISMLEAIASGCYIIMSDVGVVSEVVNKETTTLIKLEDLSSDRIVEIIEKTHDNLSEKDYNIKHFKENYNNTNIQKEIYTVIESVVL